MLTPRGPRSVPLLLVVSVVLSVPAVVGLATLTAEPASAQQSAASASVDLTLPNLPAPVPPGQTQSFSVTARYRWGQGLAAEPTTIHLEVVDQPPWLTSSFAPETYQLNPWSPTQGARVVGGVNTTQVNLTITVAPDAPAFDPGEATYRIVAEPNPPYPGAERDAVLDITAGFSGQVDVSLPQGDTVEAAGGFVTRVPLRVQNMGNGPLLLELEVLRSPAESQIVVPQDLTVGVGPGEDVVEAVLEVRVPWKVSEAGAVEVEVRPTHASRGTPAPPVEVSFQLNGKSVIPIPGPGPLAVPLAAVGLALVLGRRRG